MRQITEAKWHVLENRWSSRPLCRRATGRVLPLAAWSRLPLDLRCKRCARISAAALNTEAADAAH